MIKISYLLIVLFFTSICWSQVGNYNQFPTLPPAHLLDNTDLLVDISFAYSMRVLESDYEGPMVRLRRASDNAEEDFFCDANDKVNIVAINNWRGGSNVFMTRWYDQSGANRDAIQSIPSRQPQFIPDPLVPYFVGDGSNDVLLVEGTFNDVVQDGKNATITGVYFATNRSDFGFGGIHPTNGNDRWITHINWGDKNFYFDPGYCCNNPRNFFNDFPSNTTSPGKLEAWGQYTVIRRDDPANASVDRTIIRLESVEKVNGAFPDNRSFSETGFPFGIGACTRNNTGTNTAGHSTTRFTEMIAHNRGKENNFVLEIEENQITFWEL